MKIEKKFFLSLLLVLTMGVLASCGGTQSVERTVEMNEFAFIPSELSVPAGAEVQLTLENTGNLEHEFVIMKMGQEVTAPVNEDELEEKVYWEHELDKGQSETLTFTAPSEPGEYQVICGIAGHLEQGMEGTLTVTQ